MPVTTDGIDRHTHIELATSLFLEGPSWVAAAAATLIDSLILKDKSKLIRAQTQSIRVVAHKQNISPSSYTGSYVTYVHPSTSRRCFKVGPATKPVIQFELQTISVFVSYGNAGVPSEIPLNEICVSTIYQLKKLSACKPTNFLPLVVRRLPAFNRVFPLVAIWHSNGQSGYQAVQRVPYEPPCKSVL